MGLRQCQCTKTNQRKWHYKLTQENDKKLKTYLRRWQNIKNGQNTDKTLKTDIYSDKTLKTYSRQWQNIKNLLKTMTKHYKLTQDNDKTLTTDLRQWQNFKNLLKTMTKH